MRKMHALIDQDLLTQEDAQVILLKFQKLDQILGIMNFPQPKADAAIEALLREREEARKNQDWKKADGLRQELAKQGIEVIDTPDGPNWRRR
jgi:cysteinyl-tRNA synthetase